MNTATKNVVLIAFASTAFVVSYVLSSSKSEPPAPAAPPIATSTDASPPARFWRDPDALSRVVVDARHILITHTGSADIPMSVWMPRKQATRSKEEARVLTQRLVGELRANPGAFDEYARRYSEDEATASFGGAFGRTRIIELPRLIVNGLAALDTDEISRPIETAAGFHIVVRRAVRTTPDTFAAQQLLVPYDGALGSNSRARLGRTRDEARTLAMQLRDRARLSPESFEALAEAQHSIVNLDWGASATFAPNVNALALHALSLVGVGEIADVIDTHVGFLLLKRTDDVTRERLAAAFIGIDALRSSEAGVRARTVGLRSLAGSAPTNADDFIARQADLCASSLCDERVLTWRRGRFPFGDLERAILQTPVGEMSPLVDAALGTFLIFRIDPSGVPDESETEAIAYVTEMPDNSEWSFEEHISEMSADRLVLFVRQFETDVIDRLDVAEDKRTQAKEAVEVLAQRFETATKQERAPLFAMCEREVHAILGEDGYAELRSARDAWFTSMSRL